MTPEKAEELLRSVASGATSVPEALSALAAEPIGAMDFAAIDHHRTLRQGFPEVVFGAGKTPEQVVAIAARILARGDRLLVTRASTEALAALSDAIPGIRINALARTASGPFVENGSPPVSGALVVTAGTSDLPVAEEVTETLRAMHCSAHLVVDVGVAGIHRLLARSDELRSARAVIVVAGMDGALPSVVGGLVACPVIAVPTSVGYGTAFGGVTPLLTALNSCASGVVVVNIDNGFGAAMAAARILHNSGFRNVVTDD
jgi:NCAIR mutase (PurE)-related protein